MSNNVIISAITPSMIPLVWCTLSPMVDMAIEHSNGELDIDEIYNNLINENMILLTVSEGEEVVAVIAIEKRSFGSGKSVLNITTAGGAGMELWLDDILVVLETLAKEHDCEEIYIVGRPGWTRMLRKSGYGVIHTVVSKKIGD